jgi:hypothetical protein
MPGYRSLSTHLSGTAAEHAREAELRQRGGDSETAARLLEEALEASLRMRPEMPGWVCGRLASIYRTLKRHDDEVLLLERYRDSQTSEEARTRFDARLSKARAIAERKRRPETGALETVRQVRNRSSLRRRTPARPLDVVVAPRVVATNYAAELSAAFTDRAPDGHERLRAALTRMCIEGRAADTRMEHLVSTLKSAWQETPRPLELTEEDWHERYSTALVDLLALFFGEAA